MDEEEKSSLYNNEINGVFNEMLRFLAKKKSLEEERKNRRGKKK